MRMNMRAMLGQFQLKADQFSGFNPAFGLDFGTSWAKAIDVADAEEAASARRAQLTIDTDEVVAVLAQARTELQLLFYYAGLLYPHSAAHLNEYGRNTYAKAAYQAVPMQAELAQALKAATRDHVALAAKGYTALHISEIETLLADLTDTKATQRLKKGTNDEATDHYTTIQNVAYSFGQQVSAASKILFAGDETLLKIFRLGDGPGPATESHTLEVAPGADKWVLFATPLVAPVQLYLHLIEAEPGQQAFIGRCELEGQKPPLLLPLTQAANDQTVPVAALGEGPYLGVRNDGALLIRVELRVVAA
jgi:hypothetical protein